MSPEKGLFICLLQNVRKFVGGSKSHHDRAQVSEIVIAAVGHFPKYRYRYNPKADEMLVNTILLFMMRENVIDFEFD